MDDRSSSRNTFSMRTGVASLLSLPAEDQLALAFGDLPARTLLPPFLHETLHHVCANSAVNVAMQNRWLALLRRTLAYPAFGAAMTEAHLEDLAQLDAAEAVLQPLAEGLALFAEFDCPLTALDEGDAPGMSDYVLGRLHGQLAEDGQDMIARARRQQLDPRMVARKADVLCNPVFPDAGNDSYLLGYLVVRSLWNRLCEDPDRAPRPARFLEFMVYYLFEDWTLAEILVSGERTPHERTIARLAARLTRLFSCDLRASVDALFEDRERRSQRGYLPRGLEELTHGPFAGLDLSADELRSSMSALARFERQRVDATAALDDAPGIRGLRNLVRDSLVQPLPADAWQVGAYRERNPGAKEAAVRSLDLVLEIPRRKRAFCHLVDLEVTVTAENDRQLRISLPGPEGAARLLPTRAAGCWRGGAHAARLFVVLSSTRTPWYLLCFVLCDDQIIGAWTHGAEPDAVWSGEGEKIVSAVASEVQMEHATRLSFVGLNAYFAGNEASDAVIEQSNEATRAVARVLRSILSAQGWGPLVDERPATGDFGIRNHMASVRQVRALALAGLCNGFATSRADVDAVLDQAGYDLQELLALARDVQQRTGIALLRDCGRRVLTRI